MTFTKDPSTHPAHYPLTQERLIRVREWLQCLLAYSEGSNRDYMMADAAKAIEELLEGRKAPQLLQPEVPEEATPDDIEILASIRPPHGVAYQWDEDQRNAAADAWNACRGAMIQGNHRDLSYPAVPDESEMPSGLGVPEYNVGWANGWNSCREEMLQGAEPVSQPYRLPAEVRDVINRLLDNDGSRGTFSAVRSYDAREELERLLASSQQQAGQA